MLLGMAKPIPPDPPDWDSDYRIYADHLSVQVEERAPGIAGVYGRVGLKKILVARRVGNAGPVFCADDALGNGLVEAPRVTDGDHPFSHIHLV